MNSLDEDVTRIMVSPEEAVATRVRPLTLADATPSFTQHLRLVVAGATSMLVAAALSCVVAAYALEELAPRENVLRVLAVVAAALIIGCAAGGGALAAALVQRLSG